MGSVFVSDFDGTITKKDFYWIVIDKYLDKENMQSMYEDWQAKKIKDIDFLSFVFSNINQPESLILEEIYSIPIDLEAIEFIKFFKNNIGDFYILSAGCDYYIEKVLKKYCVFDLVTIVSNPSYYEDGNIILKPNLNSLYYSEVYGVDKGKFVNSLKQKYDFIYFSGDSRPDVGAAKEANLSFAKDQLLNLLELEKIPFVKYQSFSDIFEFVRNNL